MLNGTHIKYLHCHVHTLRTAEQHILATETNNKFFESAAPSFSAVPPAQWCVSSRECPTVCCSMAGSYPISHAVRNRNPRIIRPLPLHALTCFERPSTLLCSNPWRRLPIAPVFLPFLINTPSSSPLISTPV